MEPRLQCLRHSCRGLARGGGKRNLRLWIDTKHFDQPRCHLRGLSRARTAQQDLHRGSAATEQPVGDLLLLVQRPCEVEPIAIDAERGSGARGADERAGCRERRGPRIGVGRPVERTVLRQVDVAGPVMDVAQVHAGVTVARGPQCKAHGEPGPQAGRDRRRVALREFHQHRGRGHVVGRDYTGRNVGCEVLGGIARKARRRLAATLWSGLLRRGHTFTPVRLPAKRSLSRRQIAGGGCQVNTPYRPPAASTGVSGPFMPRTYP